MLHLTLASMVIAGGFSPNTAPADHMEISAIASSGSGLSLTGAGGKTLTNHSPVFLNLEAMLRLDRRPWLGLGLGAQLELEGRVGVALVPKIRAYLPARRRWQAYASASVPFFVFPYTLFGVGGGFGVDLHVVGALHLLAEFNAAGYFVGSDLMEDSALAKLDFALGLRLRFGGTGAKS